MFNVHAFKKGLMGKTTIINIISTIITFWALNAKAAWMIDERTFHISAHGQTACIDCHEHITSQEPHPNPVNVNKKRTEFFDPETCMMCHDDIADNLDEGIHGSKTIKERGKYRYCIHCHKPHRQWRLGDNRIGKFDPSKPRHEQCGACHEEQSALPELSAEDEACMTCHRHVDPDDPKSVTNIRRFCFHCHAPRDAEGKTQAWASVPRIDGQGYDSATHREMACTVCHLGSAQYSHRKQTMQPCSACHPPHDEKPIHDAHSLVRCEACHLEGTKPFQDPKSSLVTWARPADERKPLIIHEMTIKNKDQACQKCHVKGNQVGAAAMVLPPKSVICMPCHAATLSFSDTTTVTALLVFLTGFVMACSVWLSGTVAGINHTNYLGKALSLLSAVVKTVFSGRFVLIAKSLFFDVLLQRRLYRRSVKRWIIHSLIFIPFVMRFTWGIVGLFTTSWLKDWPLAWAIVNKNHPTTAFLFDFTGAMIGIGIVMALIRKKAGEPDQLPGLPKQDRLALCLIGGIVLIGFILEGLRIAMTGTPTGSAYATIGYGISRLFSGMTGLNDIYGYIWYLHAIMAGAFVAYLPFSRLKHIIMAPVVLIMDAVDEHDHQNRSLQNNDERGLPRDKL